jgi:hypothetical protein
MVTPWWILVVGFWLSAMANFVKDGAILGNGGTPCRPVWQVFGSLPSTTLPVVAFIEQH